MNWKCFFRHDWQRVSEAHSVEDDSEWGDNDNLGNFVLRRCKKCKVTGMKKVGWGGLTWLHKDWMYSKKEFLEKYDNKKSINKYLQKKN